MKEYTMKSFYVVKECACSGGIDVEVNNMTFPPQKDYKCNKCGKVHMLLEKEFPHMEHEPNEQEMKQ